MPVFERRGSPLTWQQMKTHVSRYATSHDLRHGSMKAIPLPSGRLRYVGVSDQPTTLNILFQNARHPSSTNNCKRRTKSAVELAQPTSRRPITQTGHPPLKYFSLVEILRFTSVYSVRPQMGPFRAMVDKVQRLDVLESYRLALLHTLRPSACLGEPQAIALRDCFVEVVLQWPFLHPFRTQFLQPGLVDLA